MKRLLLCITLIALSAITSLAQKADYTKYHVIAQTSDVSIVVKDNDYRMVVGSLKKPKTIFLLGHSKDQAAQRFKQLLEQVDNKNYSKKNRQVSFCGADLRLTVADSKADNVMYDIIREDNNVKFKMNKSDILGFVDKLH